jgi:phenylacetate-CoA ligase
MAKRGKKIVMKSGKRSVAARNKASRSSHQIGPLVQNWPSLPKAVASLGMAVFSQSHIIERMPIALQSRLQLRQIERVLRHAFETVPFYRDRLDGISDIPDGEMDEEFISSLPVLTRSEIQIAGQELHSTRPPPEHGAIYISRTSGSTGKPIEVQTTFLRNITNIGLSMRAHYWHRLDLTQKSVDIRTAFEPGTEPKNVKWSPLPWSGPGKRLDINLPISELFDQFIKEDPYSVFSHPYTLMLLAERSRKTGIFPRNLSFARSFGEALSPKIRETLLEVWNVPIIDSYSATEIGFIANQCSDNENLHVQVENVRVEILDEDGNPCKPGTVGRVVITTLQNFASPLIRYEIGDYAEVGENCSCGRSLPVLTRILGRHRNLCVLKNGERFFPEIQANLKPFSHIRQFQAHQRTLDDIDLKIVAARPFTNAEKKEVQAIMQKKFHYPFKVNIIEVDDIPRAANGKFEEFKSDLQAARIDS